jgi:hypothetical protein
VDKALLFQISFTFSHYTGVIQVPIDREGHLVSQRQRATMPDNSAAAASSRLLLIPMPQYYPIQTKTPQSCATRSVGYLLQANSPLLLASGHVAFDPKSMLSRMIPPAP